MTLRDILRPAPLRNPFKLGEILLHMPQFIRLFYALLTEPRVPMLTKLIPLFGLLMMVSPPILELDVIPLIGEIDNLVIIYFTLELFVWLCTPDVVREHVTRIAHSPA